MDFREFSKKNRDGILLALILLSSLVAMMVQSSRFTSVPEQVGMGISSGVESVFSGTRNFFTNTVKSVSELRDLRREYNQLLDKLNEQQQIFTSMQALEEENKQLRDSLGYSRKMQYSNVPAMIIGKDPGVVFTSLMINKGSRAGIKEGMTVVAFQGGDQGLVGKIIEVSPFSSLIRPIVDPQSYVSARLSKIRYEGLIHGLGSESESLVMEYLDREARNQINVGDEVITSGLNSIYPGNLRIGLVSGISANSYDTSLELDVIPFINFTRLEQVFILIPSVAPSGSSGTGVTGSQTSQEGTSAAQQGGGPLFIPSDSNSNVQEDSEAGGGR